MELRAPDLERMRLYVYRRPLHPELFTLFLEKRFDTDRFEARLWLIGTGHLISFHRDDVTVSELLTSRDDLLPEKGLLESLPVDRDRDYQVNQENQIYYLLNLQAEQMSEPVFARVHEEMTRFAQTRGMFITFEQWAEEGRPPPFSFIDYERRPTELDVFAYHAFPQQKVMIRTQSVFSTEPISVTPEARPEGPFGRHF